jgi:WD40 repeat protein
VLYSHREPLGAVACSPDGTRVAAVEGESHASSHVSYWDTATRTRTTMKFSGMRTTDVAITSDGRHLLAVGMGTLIPEYGLFAAFDLGTDPPTRVDPARDTESPGWRIAALPDPTLAIRHRVNWPSHAGEFEVIRVPSGEPVRQLAPSEGVMGRFALSPDGTRLATCGAGMALYDLTDTGARAVATREAPHTPPQSVAFTAAGRLFGAFSGSVVEFDGAEVAAEAGLERRRGELLFETIRSLAADPAGEFIYVGTWQGKVCAFATDPLRLLAAFEWHMGAVTGLAVSADGSRLFSSGGDGCVKVWPIRDLLRVAG